MRVWQALSCMFAVLLGLALAGTSAAHACPAHLLVEPAQPRTSHALEAREQPPALNPLPDLLLEQTELDEEPGGADNDDLAADGSSFASLRHSAAGTLNLHVSRLELAASPLDDFRRLRC